MLLSEMNLINTVCKKKASLSRIGKKRELITFWIIITIETVLIK